MRVSRALPPLLLLAGLCSWTQVSKAQEDRRQQCIQAYESGQRLKKAGDLVEASSRLAFCANKICPPLMRDDCAARLSEVKAATPAVILSVKFSAGRAPVRVSIDGQARAWAEDVASLTVNPGRHELRVEAEGFPSQTRSLLLGEGEKAATVEVMFKSVSAPEPPAAPELHPPPAAPPRSRPPPTAALVVTASSLIGATGFVYFGLTARKREDDLAQRCSPSCTSAQVTALKHRYLLANVSLGLGLASLLGGGILFWVHSARGSATETRAASKARRVSETGIASVAVQVAPSYVGVLGNF